MNLLRSLGLRGSGATQTATSGSGDAGEFPQYEAGLPSAQTAIDLLPGWNCSFPESFGLEAGILPLHADPRILWALKTYGPIKGKSVLEVGPLEGMHTFMLNARRPARIDAVEANRLCYLRCLVAAQILDLDRARFHLGDVRKWLEAEGRRYDLVVASGVLYHMSDPARFLGLAARRTDALYLWTHYYTEEALTRRDRRRKPFTGRVVVAQENGIAIRTYERGYLNSDRSDSFCGGMSDRHFWMHRDDILALLASLGLTEITIGSEDRDHPGGPCFSLLARRPSTTEEPGAVQS